MMHQQKTVFISYRRNVASFIARAIFMDLRAHGYDVFMDVESIDSGMFDTIIFRQIEARAHFVLILTPGTMERFVEPEDWLKREVEHAVDTNRNIVPLLVNGFSFESSNLYLKGKLSELNRYNALDVPHVFFEEAMVRLRTRFLKQSNQTPIRKVSESDRLIVTQKLMKVVDQALPTESELQAETLFHQAKTLHLDGDFEAALIGYSKAIEINPNYYSAYINRGNVRRRKEDLDGALADYNLAIRSAPDKGGGYNNRAIVKRRKGDFAGAIEDFSQAVLIDSSYAKGYNNRGEVYFILGEYELAKADFLKANDIRPSYNMALLGLAITYYMLEQLVEARDTWNEVIERDQRFRDIAWLKQELHWAKPLVATAKLLIAEL